MTVPFELAAVAALASFALAILAVRGGGRTLADRAFLVGLLCLAGERALAAAAYGPLDPVWIFRLQRWRLAADSLLPASWLLFSLAFARANATVFLRRWRWALIAAVLLPVGLAWFGRNYLVDTSEVTAEHPLPRLGLSGIALYLVGLIGALTVLVNLERTVRAAVGTIRWRIKFIILGVGVVFVARIYTASQALVFREFANTLDTVDSLGAIIGVVVMLRGVIRAPEFTSDVYPSLSVLQGSVTITVAGLYLLLVGLFAKIVTRFGGDASFALKTFWVLVALVGVAVLLQSDRLRLKVRRFLSRNFNRPAYDYRMVWRAYTEGTAACVESTDLCRSMVRITADLFQTLSVSVWLLNERRDTFALAASTSVSADKGRELAPSPADTNAILTHFEHHSEAIDIESNDAEWANALRHCHPSDFPMGGNRICVPMLRQQRLVGLLFLGDWVNGFDFPQQDFDLLECIANQAAASLVNIQMSQRLLESKELEAFQTMATFFVHDLKNAASTLNLMLKNLPVHFDDPEFRQDALRGIGKTVDHINRLTGRLSTIRHQLKLAPVQRDLNEVVKAALADLDQATAGTITRELQPVPPTLVDPEQLRKVILNLVLNATEASPPQAPVRVSTGQQNGWLMLTVADNGCGMTEEFMRNSLFRPFQTTKKQGLGIGMFQSRMIVEAHGGRISVSSQPGQGTTFQVFLPVRSPSE